MSRTSWMPLVLAGLVLLGAAGLWWMLRTPPSHEIVPSAGGSSARETSDLEGLGRASREAARVPADEPATAAAGDGTAAPAEPSSPGALRPVAVRVVDEDGLPQEGLVVGISDGERWAGGAPTGLTGADGRCGFEVLPWSPGELRAVHVREPDGPTRFLAPCPMEAELLIVLPAGHLVLRGRLVTEPELDLAGGMVAAYAPPREGIQDTGQFQARGSLDARGRFELELPGAFTGDRLRLTFTAERSELGSAYVALAELLDPEGALVILELTRLVLEVRDTEDVALAGIEVRAEELGDSRQVALHQGRTDGDGFARMTLPRSPFEVAVGGAGWTPAVLLYEEPPAQELRERVVLRRVDEGELVAGIVLDPGGRPLADAFVSLAAHGRSMAVFHLSHRGLRTGEDGLFRLETPGDLPFDLHAHHRAHGLLSRPALRLPLGFVTLRFEALGTLRVEVRAEGLDPANRPGKLEAGLLDERGALVDWGLTSTWAGKLELEELTAGERDVFVYLGGREALGRARVVVRAGETVECSVDLRQGARLAGRALDAEGRPIAAAEVRSLDPSLPPALRGLWSSPATGADGRFSVFASDPAGCSVEVRAADGRSWSGFVGAGGEVEVILR